MIGKLLGIKRYSKLSFSQTGEDCIINFAFNHIGIQKPSYIDIGAHHPFRLSNTALFYNRGSRGINIEPEVNLFNAFLKHRPKDINLNIGIADKPNSLEFYLMSDPGLNTFSKEEALRMEKAGKGKIIKQMNIAVDTVINVIDKYCGGKCPQLMSIDVEGFDEAILKSIDFEKIAPVVICAETIDFEETGEKSRKFRITDLLLSKGYFVLADTTINTIYIKEAMWH